MRVLLAALALFVHDSAERFPLTSVGASPVSVPGAPPDSAPRVYRRQVGEWTQLWLFFASNPHDRGVLRTGRHAGDWEVVQFRPGRDIVLSQHSSAERCPWSEVTLEDGLPVVHVAHGSHALYLDPGRHDRTWPDPNDETDGGGVRLAPPAVDVSWGEPPWMRWRGRWGGARARWFVPGESSSPRGPAFQGIRWDDPDGWAASARPCGDDGDELEVVMTFGVALVAFVVAGVILWRRRVPAVVWDELPQ